MARLAFLRGLRCAALPALLLSGLAACASPSPATSTISVNSIMTGVNVGYGLLKTDADLEVAAGRLDATKVAAAEHSADVALSVVSAGGAAFTSDPQGAAKGVLAALQAFTNLVPAASLSAGTVLAITGAEASLGAFIALSPTTAAGVAADPNATTIVPAA